MNYNPNQPRPNYQRPLPPPPEYRHQQYTPAPSPKPPKKQSFWTRPVGKPCGKSIPMWGCLVGIILLSCGSCWGLEIVVSNAYVDSEITSAQNFKASLQATASAQPTTSSTSSSNYKIGQTAKVNNMEVTVSKVSTIGPTEFDYPGTSSIYIIFDVSVKNSTGDTVGVYDEDFSLIGSNGHQYKSTITGANENDTLYNGNLQDGSTARGKIVYAIPQTAKSFTLIYQPNLYPLPKRAVWGVNL